MSKSSLERALAVLIHDARLPKPEREYRFAAEAVGKGRGVRARLEAAGLQDWRADFAWTARRVLCEVQGGKWKIGRHQRPQGYENDCRKMDDAQELGWRMLYVTGDMIASGEAVRRLERALQDKDD